jgi:hypothetical protein
MNAQYLGVVEAGGNVPSLSLILEVAEVLGADAGEMIPRGRDRAPDAEKVVRDGFRDVFPIKPPPAARS